MPQVASVLVDFDGTACAHDVAEHLLIRFGDPTWPDYDAAWDRGELGARDVLRAQAAMLAAPREELLSYALEHCPMEPTFATFVEWASRSDVPVKVVSDGFGFYIEPLLDANDIRGIEVVTNTWIGDKRTQLAFENGHDVCISCGTCKMRSVLEAPGPVAFVGEGSSDRFGALYADVTFAKDTLVDWCVRDGVPYVPWRTFDDVRARLESDEPLPGPVAPARCPGWRTA
jgi:2-hydroxy-3-keto-5-methylthiopentenyl-1-phosphate phosphatase